MATGGGVTCVIASGTAEGVIPAVASGSHVGTRFAAPAAARAGLQALAAPRQADPGAGGR